MSSSNTNCLAGIKCPHCGGEDAFHISARLRVYVTDDGVDAADNSCPEWEPDSHTECAECGADGPLSNFRTSTI